MDLAQRLAAFERADLYVVITESFAPAAPLWRCWSGFWPPG